MTENIPDRFTAEYERFVEGRLPPGVHKPSPGLDVAWLYGFFGAGAVAMLTLILVGLRAQEHVLAVHVCGLIVGSICYFVVRGIKARYSEQYNAVVEAVEAERAAMIKQNLEPSFTQMKS